MVLVREAETCMASVHVDAWVQRGQPEPWASIQIAAWRCCPSRPCLETRWGPWTRLHALGEQAGDWND